MTHIFSKLTPVLFGLFHQRFLSLGQGGKKASPLFLRRHFMAGGFLAFSFIFGVLYVFEFHAALSMGEAIAVYQKEVKDIENELNKNEAAYSRAYASAISAHFEVTDGLGPVTEIEYLEKKALVVSPSYFP